MIESGLPYSVPVRLHQAGSGLERHLEPDAAERAKIAKSLDLASLDAFDADIKLEPSGHSGWRVSGRVRADAVQTCGLTLEPLPVRIDRKFSVQMVEATEHEADENAEIDLELDDDSADQIEGGSLDLGQYAVEQLALSLDPFPRKPGAVFEQPPEPGEISPFAVLKGLRPTDGSGEG